MDLPIVCTLTPAQMAERRQSILRDARAATVHAEPLAQGYAFTFPATSENLILLTTIVDLERQCCQFLSFKILVEAGQAMIRFEVTGPENAKAIIEDFFGA